MESKKDFFVVQVDKPTKKKLPPPVVDTRKFRDAILRSQRYSYSLYKPHEED